MDAETQVAEELPDCPEYHPLSELGGKMGWYPNISNEQLSAASRLREMIEEHELMNNFIRADPDEPEFLKLLRFLRARKWDLKNALEMIRSDLEWRSEEDRFGLRWDSAEEVLDGVDLNRLYKYYPTWIQGHDKQFRPISYRQFGRFEIWNILEFTSMEKVLRFHVWEMEQILRCMHQNTRICGHNVETFVVVVDVSGWSLKLTTGDAMALARGMANTDSDHYPERLGVMLLINAPSVLSFAWRVIQTFLDEVQKAKIKIMGSDPKEWQPVLFDLIDRDQVPQMYGGFAADPTPETAFASMNPPSDTVAFVKRKEGKLKASSSRTGSASSSSSSVSAPKKAQEKPPSSKAKPFPWYHNICQVPLCKDGDDDFDFIVHFNSVPGDRRPVIETLNERSTVEIATQTDDRYFVDVPATGAKVGTACHCAVM